MNHYSQEALDVSGYPFILSAPQKAQFASVQWILRDNLAFGDIEIQGAGGQCSKFWIFAFKKCRNIKGSCYFQGKHATDKKNSVLANISFTLSGKRLRFSGRLLMFECDNIQLCLISYEPQPLTAGKEFSHISYAVWGSLGE